MLDDLLDVETMQNLFEQYSQLLNERDVSAVTRHKQFATKDSGKRESYESGMVRDTEEGKPRFDLLIPRSLPFEDQILTRFARLMERGAKKYKARNWELARGHEEYERYLSSAHRHMMQWLCDDRTEDHAAAVMFNIMAAETVRYHMEAE